MITCLLLFGAQKIAFTATAPATFSLGSSKPLVVQLTITNKTKVPLTVWSCGFWPNHLITIKDEKGHLVTLTKFGVAMNKTFSSLVRDKNAPLKILAAKSYSYSTPDLRQCYQLKPGKYTVSVRYNDAAAAPKFTMISTSSQFTVAK
jgi:hypothetical protein